MLIAAAGITIFLRWPQISKNTSLSSQGVITFLICCVVPSFLIFMATGSLNASAIGSAFLTLPLSQTAMDEIRPFPVFSSLSFPQILVVSLVSAASGAFVGWLTRLVCRDMNLKNESILPAAPPPLLAGWGLFAIATMMPIVSSERYGSASFQFMCFHTAQPWMVAIAITGIMFSRVRAIAVHVIAYISAVFLLYVSFQNAQVWISNHAYAELHAGSCWLAFFFGTILIGVGCIQSRQPSEGDSDYYNFNSDLPAVRFVRIARLLSIAFAVGIAFSYCLWVINLPSPKRH